MTEKRRNGLIAFALFVVLTFVYLANRDVLPGDDATPSVRLALQMIDNGRLSLLPSEAPTMFTWTLQSGEPLASPPRSLDEVSQGKTAREFYRAGVIKVAGPKYYLAPTTRIDAETQEPVYASTFGVGAAMSALPVLIPLQLALLDLRKFPVLMWHAAKLSASLYVAGAAAIVFLIALRFTTRGRALALAAALGLGTCVWSTSSQSLWQHGPNEFFLALGIYFFLAIGDRDPRTGGSTEDIATSPRAALFSGLAFGAATGCRPTSALFAWTIAIYLIRHDRKVARGFILGALPFAFALGAYGTYFFGAPWRTGQGVGGAAIALAKTGSAHVFQTPPWEGLAGLLLSPSRGLFVFSPFLLVALWGIWIVWRSADYPRLRVLSIAALFVLLLESAHFDWWGGWSYGYRHIVDLTVVLAVLAAPAMSAACANAVRNIGFGALVLWSVGVQFVGAFAYDVQGWNGLVRYTFEGPDGKRVTALGDVEAAALDDLGAKLIERTPLDIDLPENRKRLWSFSDNEISYYVEHYTESRAAKAKIVSQMFLYGD